MPLAGWTIIGFNLYIARIIKGIQMKENSFFSKSRCNTYSTKTLHTTLLLFVTVFFEHCVSDRLPLYSAEK
ncbi:hypothetical protein Bca4012_077838 [Brassica carinata]